MKIVTCASYYGSGSSAVVDLISEYKSVKNLGNYEFRFLHDIDGVSDLEFHLTECPNRHNSGHAIKRFEKLVRFYSGSFFEKRYEKYFDNKFLTISAEYIDNLVALKYKGWWFYDLYDKGRFFYNIKQLQNHFFRIFTRKANNVLKKERTYCSLIDKEHFLFYTREYTNKLFNAANNCNYDFLLVDQLVSSQNIDRIMNYFKDEVFVFVVDRDPRDIYILEMIKWKECVIPHNPNDFCKWYRITHSIGTKSNNPKVVYLHFEDLIYKYNETVAKIENLLHLTNEKHINPFSIFNPLSSVNNTMLFKKYDKYKNAIEIIEGELGDYLYDFESVKHNQIPGKRVNNKGLF